MNLRRLSSTFVAASLAFACVPAQAPTPKLAERPTHARYVIITPHVSVSGNAQPLPEPPVRPEPTEDVMAEILALPPG